MSGRIFPLHEAQRDAVDPKESVWLSASAGTGKTQVLSARVLRLLLQDEVTPSQILCLTFTKAGAAEMAERINDTLARWVRMPAEALAADLRAIGADFRPAAQDRARTLFASVLDCPGGGLRIDTIHAFAQWILSAFPEEAGLTPGTRAIEDRERDLLAREVLSELLIEAQASADDGMLDALSLLSRRMGPDAVEKWLMRCAGARAAWFGPRAWQPPLGPRVKRLLGLDPDADAGSLAALCADHMFDVASVRRCMDINRAWKTATGEKQAAALAEWLAADPAARLAGLDGLASVFLTKDNAPRKTASLDRIDPDYPELAMRVIACINALREQRALLDLAEFLTPALTLGRRFALAWEEAKQREGYIDFDDQIHRAAQLLNTSALADWIRYKLDRRFDHILIDEAQDTNSAQWDIVRALTGDFFTGEGQHADRMRTLFVVGDYKQAIFRFQGTSPENFEAARQLFEREMANAAHNARDLRGAFAARELRMLGLGRSFRTAQRVLDFVDSAIEAIGHRQLGLRQPADSHVGEERPGLVVLWPVAGSAEEDSEGNDEEGQDNWLSRPERVLADRIARQVRHWMDCGFPLVKGVKPGQPPRRAGPGDVMVLVRKRRDLAGLIVARLYARGVPVAGVDRLRLGGPLAVRDLLAALRFAAQPLDDLNLANLLVSPLIGWTQQQLLDHGWRGENVRLWDHLRQGGHPDVAAVLERLRGLLALADFEPPQALLHWVLTGPWQGRRKLVARLGREANDPIDELVNAAHAYTGAHTASLEGFLQWFDSGDGKLKREADGGRGQVRVMTVHGSKGLQAPIVILADAAGRPGGAAGMDLDLSEEAWPGVDAGMDSGGDACRVPMPRLRKEELAGRIRQAADQAGREELEEHWRLLYVAMTRAEEALFIGGALGARETQPHDDSWYARLAPLFADDPVEDPIWGTRREWGALTPWVAPPEPASAPQASALALPDWATRPVEAEPRPPRPLAPSAAGRDDSAEPPFPVEAGRVAARRGIVMHALLERLPGRAPEDRRDAAMAWLARNAADLDGDAHAEMTDAVLSVLQAPEWAEIFAPGALAEVPFAAVVDGQVIAGTVDRLLVSESRVLVVDFKTARRPPASLEEVPVGTLRQMGAYAAALGAIYPGRAVEVALLYTQTPRLIAVPAGILAAHKPGLYRAEESYPA